MLAFLAAVFSFGNWYSVEVHLWGGLIALVNLPFLLLVTFLVGLLPMMAYHVTARWRLRQRLVTAERTVESLRFATQLAEPPVVPPPLPLPTIQP